MSPPNPYYWCDPHPPETHPLTADGRRHCGILEQVIRRQWRPDTIPPAELVAAVDFLATLPGFLASRLADWLDGIWLGDATVPGLDDLGHMAGQPLREGSATTWDVVPGALVGRTMVIGTGEHLSVSLAGHEVGHAVEQMDGMADDEEWQTIMKMCRDHLFSDKFADPREWWAESWAAVATRQFGALQRMLSGRRDLFMVVAMYHARHYGLGR